MLHGALGAFVILEFLRALAISAKVRMALLVVFPNNCAHRERQGAAAL